MKMMKKGKEECCEYEWMAKKKIMMGLGVTVVGLLWWANSTGMIKLEPFWPIIVTVAGVVFIAKGLYMKMM